MISQMIKAFLLVFAAEMGDKSQIIAMTFATQFKRKDVLIGVAIAAILNHGLAIVLGSYLSKVIPLNIIQIVAGLAFIVFGILSLKDEEMDEYKENRNFGPIVTVALAFFISELGDKTQLTAMALASDAISPILILLGTSSAMVTTSALGIIIGSKIGDKIPDVLIKVVSSIVFVLSGIIKLSTTISGENMTKTNLFIFIAIILVIEIYFIIKLYANRKTSKSPMKEVAANLYAQTESLKQSLDSICLGDKVCGTCSGKDCLIGFIRFIIKEARDNDMYYNGFSLDVEKFIKKDYEEKQLIQSLAIIIIDYHKYRWDDNDDFVVKKIKRALEYILFNKTIDEFYNIDNYLMEVNKIHKRLANLLEAEIAHILN